MTGREMKGRIDQTQPINTDQPVQERPVYDTPRRIERQERRVEDAPGRSKDRIGQRIKYLNLSIVRNNRCMKRHDQ